MTATARLSRAVAVIVLAGLLAPLAACSGNDGSDPAPTGSPGTGGGDSGGDGASGGPRTVPPQLRECEDRGDVPDLAAATWTNPDGFDEEGGYTQIAPITESRTDTYLVPSSPGTGIEIISLVHYTDVPEPLVDACGVVDRKAVELLLDRWHREGDITATAPEWAEVGNGVAAVTEAQQYAGYDFIVAATLVIGEGELLLIGCQWVTSEVEVTSGCDTVVDSLAFG
ncbi:hypothetical protein [Ruania alba]|nr:hypothetical protein [Ruania alba]